ncbi:archease [Methanoplanus sp. FWC-SCC4]|uniref:Archease n=1 Tax=Methanochimaera problematica TaxID=2609417 RepID=A0AA97FBT5_9EURY|nr:archease [Methanoplanus sp. FWC-SCC4]WOF16059.1 archease [Methanoplanus sp. FWC-SCC4]
MNFLPFEELDHTADFLFRCKGNSIEELFSASASAMFSIMFEDRKNQNVIREFTVSADSYESLLLDFLSELLFISEVDGIVFSDVSVKLNDKSLFASAVGEYFDKSRHMGGSEIKGISRSGIVIKKNEGLYQVDIIFDV